MNNTNIKPHFTINDIVYFVVDDENDRNIITGIVDRGDCIRYLVSNKTGETEVSANEISLDKNIV